MNRYIKVLIATISLTLCGCTQSHNKATLANNPLKDSIAINTFMDFRLGSSREEAFCIIDSLINVQQIKDYRAIKNDSDRFSWCYTAASVDRMEERHVFEGSIIAKGNSGQYNQYKANIELQFYQDTLYSVFVYPGSGYNFDGLSDEGIYNMFTDKYSEHYTLNTYGPITVSDYYELFWFGSEISKYTSFNANSREWEFKTSTIGVATLTTKYTEWKFEPDSYMRVIKDSSYDERVEHERTWLAEDIISKAIIQSKTQDSYDRIYFWYRNDIIQEQLDELKAEQKERQRQYQIEQQNKREKESNEMQKQFQKQTI